MNLDQKKGKIKIQQTTLPGAGREMGVRAERVDRGNSAIGLQTNGPHEFQPKRTMPAKFHKLLLFIHYSFNKYLLSVYYMPGTLLGAVFIRRRKKSLQCSNPMEKREKT